MVNFGDAETEDLLERQIIITVEDFQKGATAPTDQTVGTTPEIPVLLFDATNETAGFNAMLPRDIDVAVNSKLILTVALSEAESNNDTLDMTLDYVVVDEGQNSNLTKTSTQVTGTRTVTTAEGLALGDVYTIEFNFDHGDANNPLTALSTAILIEFHLTNITGVVEFHLISGCYAYEALY